MATQNGLPHSTVIALSIMSAIDFVDISFEPAAPLPPPSALPQAVEWDDDAVTKTLTAIISSTPLPDFVPVTTYAATPSIENVVEDTVMYAVMDAVVDVEIPLPPPWTPAPLPLPPWCVNSTSDVSSVNNYQPGDNQSAAMLLGEYAKGYNEGQVLAKSAKEGKRSKFT